jgi:hypothetical protein
VQAQDVSHFSIFQTSSGVHQTSYPIGTAVVSPETNRTGREADHSLLSIAEDNNGGNYTSTPHTSSLRGA